MKKIVIFIISLLLFVGIGFGVYYFKNVNYIGVDVLYVKIIMDGEKGKNVSFNYFYIMLVYDEVGKEIEVIFFVDKNLCKGVYLKLYIKEDKGVIFYEEVLEKEVFFKVVEKFK